MLITELGPIERGVLCSWLGPKARNVVAEFIRPFRFDPELHAGATNFMRAVDVMIEAASDMDNTDTVASLSLFRTGIHTVMTDPKYKILLVSTASILTPPERYGGMERMVAYFRDTAHAIGHTVHVVAKNGSTVGGLIGTATDENDFPLIVADILGEYDVIVDFSHDKRIGRAYPDFPQLNVYQVMTVGWPRNPVFISEAQRRFIGKDGPVVYYGLDLIDYPMKSRAGGHYLLYMGSLIPEKRVEWAVAIAKMLGMPIKIAGPSWTPEYFDNVCRPLFGDGVEYVGDVGGEEKLQLLQGAAALVHPVGASGWVEAGAIVVQESLAVGTPVFATDNGCLPEYIKDGENGVIGTTPLGIAGKAAQFLATDKDPEKIRASLGHLCSLSMVYDYTDLIEEVLEGETWGG